MLASLSGVTHAPDRLISVFAEEEAAVFGDGNTDGTPPHVSVGGDETSYEIFVVAPRSSGRFIERDPDDLVTCPSLAIPGTVEGRKDVALIFRRKFGAFVETEIERGRVALDEHVRRQNLAGKLGMLARVARVLMISEIKPWPAIEPSRLHVADVIWHQIVAQFIAFVSAHPELICAGA